MEINLSTKCKLGLVRGTLAQPTNDQAKGDQWDSCTNLVVAWIMNNVSSSISKSILSVSWHQKYGHNWRDDLQ